MWLLDSLLTAANTPGVGATRFDAVAAILGVALIVESVIARKFARRELFLVDAGWYVLLAVKVAFGVWNGTYPNLWSAAFPLCTFQVLEDVKLYGDFADSVTHDGEPHVH